MKPRAMNYGAIFIALTMLLVLPAQAYACACCSDPGVWRQGSTDVDEFHFDEMNRLTFAPKAELYMTDAGEDMIQGMSSVSDGYNLLLSKNQRQWALKFKDKEGKTGTLSFSIPARMVYYIVDLHNGQESGGGGPMLYHEWRISGPVSGTGVFKKGMIGKTKFQLVLQGTGNSCADAGTFDNWNLQISGPRADYSFYGTFKDATPATGSKSVSPPWLLKSPVAGDNLSFLS